VDASRHILSHCFALGAGSSAYHIVPEMVQQPDLYLEPSPI
jgi:hypothetical protein